jgi:hypothetical protein
MDDGLRVFVLSILSSASLAGAFLAIEALFPAVIERTRQAATDSPGQSFLLGLVNIFFLAGAGLGLSALADGVGFGLLQVPAIILLALLVIMLTLGLTGMAGLIGERLFPEASTVTRLVGGSLVAILGSLAPFIGWFGLFVYLAATGMGGFLLGWARRPRAAQGDPDLVDSKK